MPSSVHVGEEKTTSSHAIDAIFCDSLHLSRTPSPMRVLPRTILVLTGRGWETRLPDMNGQPDVIDSEVNRSVDAKVKSNAEERTNFWVLWQKERFVVLRFSASSNPRERDLERGTRRPPTTQVRCKRKVVWWKEVLSEDYFPKQVREQWIWRAKKRQIHNDYRESLDSLLDKVEEYIYIGHGRDTIHLQSSLTERCTIVERFANGLLLNFIIGPFHDDAQRDRVLHIFSMLWLGLTDNRCTAMKFTFPSYFCGSAASFTRPASVPGSAAQILSPAIRASMNTCLKVADVR
ncbi:uncharacterized protein BT62DRAFT_1014391 [Guyanagaster necrorhizus]|uniref:HAM1-like N-terminal domain-containing protein n=1 Tax=Guyanagaster necrorhizus TaxID=856835 RepID=A0A9P7VEJ5_9AGAR|nr:uncharacterized protein BT62DRAFT_1014391 [Guyanagaster necrorhizus MCA 3950]KAG7439090.1 hypothetical protein BT62DRAFT_1014391 [Guyanagaster necrorhizus MCA 3950]